MSKRRRRILLTNDDGIHAEGLLALLGPLGRIADLTVVAPAEEQSGVSHSIIYRRPIACRRVKLAKGVAAWAVDAYPVDCVKLAFDQLLDEKPDLVVSGINRGANLGGHLFYSGTVAAALEASVMGVTGLAVSLEAPIGNPDALERTKETFDFGPAAKVLVEVLRLIDRAELGRAPAVNINIPATGVKIRGIRWAAQCRGPMPDTYLCAGSSEGRRLFQMRSTADDFEPDADSDRAMLRKGYVTLTPMRCDLTCRKTLARVRRSSRS